MTLQDKSPGQHQSAEERTEAAQVALVNGESLQQRLGEEVAKPTHEHQPFAERLHHALEDENLSRALGRFAPSWRDSRKGVFSVEENDYGPEYSFPSLRSRLRTAKD